MLCQDARNREPLRATAHWLQATGMYCIKTLAREQQGKEAKYPAWPRRRQRPLSSARKVGRSRSGTSHVKNGAASTADALASHSCDVLCKRGILERFASHRFMGLACRKKYADMPSMCVSASYSTTLDHLPSCLCVIFQGLSAPSRKTCIYTSTKFRVRHPYDFSVRL